jgi:hypothetical protein
MLLEPGIRMAPAAEVAHETEPKRFSERQLTVHPSDSQTFAGIGVHSASDLRNSTTGSTAVLLRQPAAA